MHNFARDSVAQRCCCRCGTGLLVHHNLAGITYPSAWLQGAAVDVCDSPQSLLAVDYLTGAKFATFVIWVMLELFRTVDRSVKQCIIGIMLRGTSALELIRCHIAPVLALLQRNPDQFHTLALRVFDVVRLLSDFGWRVTH